jgi:hypothetical protein
MGLEWHRLGDLQAASLCRLSEPVTVLDDRHPMQRSVRVRWKESKEHADRSDSTYYAQQI